MVTIFKFVVRFIVLAFITLLTLASISVGVVRENTASKTAPARMSRPVPVDSLGYPMFMPGTAQWKRAPSGGLPPKAI